MAWPSFAYYPNGVLKTEINYVEGDKVGVVKQYHTDGSLLKMETYKQGLLNGKKAEYNLAGKPQVISQFKGNEYAQTSEIYDINGQRLPTPEIDVALDDKRTTTGTIDITLSVKNVTNISKSVFAVEYRNRNNQLIRINAMPHRSKGIVELEIPPGVRVSQDFTIYAKCRSRSGYYFGVVRNYTLNL